MNQPSSGEQSAASVPHFSFKGHYVKDLSFENPRAPHSLFAVKDAPKIDISVDLEGQKLQEEVFELTIRVSARALMENKTLFMVDLSYGGIFELMHIPQEHVQQVLLVDCAYALFPFARRVISDATRDGGFPALNLEPIDFARLFMEKAASAQQPA